MRFYFFNELRRSDLLWPVYLTHVPLYADDSAPQWQLGWGGSRYQPGLVVVLGHVQLWSTNGLSSCQMQRGVQEPYDGREGRPVLKAPHPAVSHQVVPEGGGAVSLYVQASGRFNATPALVLLQRAPAVVGSLHSVGPLQLGQHGLRIQLRVRRRA